MKHVTALVLTAVMLAMAWMVVVAYRPDTLRLASLEVEVILILTLLLTALILVSVVALLHTRPPKKTEEE